MLLLKKEDGQNLNWKLSGLIKLRFCIRNIISAISIRMTVMRTFFLKTPESAYVSRNKFYNDLLKQNSMIHNGWDVYRWAVRQMQVQPETVKDELRIFLGSHLLFREIADYLPAQRGKSINAENLQLKEHQHAALKSLEEMRERYESIALLYHATGTVETVTAVSDAKRFGKRTLFLAHTIKFVNQAYETFRNLWKGVSVGKFGDAVKEKDAHIVCGKYSKCCPES